MDASKSFQLGPPKFGSGRIFIDSQFCAKYQDPPKSTNLSGKTAIITGASTGLGFHSCRQFLSVKLSRLILTVRSMKKGEEAATKLRAEFPGATIDVWELEMGSYDSVQAFVRRVENELSRLDIAVLNAGLVMPDFGLTSSTGHEETIQVNFLSTYLLATLLLPALKTKSPPDTPGRLTVVGSGTVYNAEFPNRSCVPLLKSFDDVTIQPWDANERYSCSKLLGHLFFVKMAAYINPDDVIVNIVDPGFCKGSDLHRNAYGLVGIALSVAKALTGRTLEVGASTYLDAAVIKGKEAHGSYVMDWDIRP